MITKFMRFLALGVYLLLVSGCSDDSNASVEHFLLICADTVRADTFYQLGQMQKDALSPWEERAVVFDQATAPAPWTVPTLASVFSGLSVPEHGGGLFAGENANLVTSVPGKLNAKVPMLAEVLKEKGRFRTAVITASGWTSPGLGRNVGLTRGIDDIVSFEEVGKAADWRPLVAKWRELFLSQTEDSRVFHFLHLMEAHEWHTIPAEDISKLILAMSADERALYRKLAPEQACIEEDSMHCQRFMVYASAVRELRLGLATVLEHLANYSLLDKTAVVLFSDHGEEFNDHPVDWRGPDTPSRLGHGATLYQEQLHVPLLIWSPQVQGTHITSPVSLVDIAPTVARWLAVDFTPESWQGRYLDDYIASPGAHSERAVYSTGIAFGPQQISARVSGHKSIWHLGPDRIDYFDLGTDPDELSPIASDDLVMMFDGLFVDFLQNSPKVDVVPGELTVKQAQKLQAIGYLQGLEADADK